MNIKQLGRSVEIVGRSFKCYYPGLSQEHVSTERVLKNMSDDGLFAFTKEGPASRGQFGTGSVHVSYFDEQGELNAG